MSPKAREPHHWRRCCSSANAGPGGASALSLSGGNVDSAQFARVLAAG